MRCRYVHSARPCRICRAPSQPSPAGSHSSYRLWSWLRRWGEVARADVFVFVERPRSACTLNSHDDSRADAYYPESRELGGKTRPRDPRRPLLRGPHRNRHRIHGTCPRFLAPRRVRTSRLGIGRPASASIGSPTPSAGSVPQICCYLVPPHCRIGPRSPRSLGRSRCTSGVPGLTDHAAEVAAISVPGPVRESRQTGRS